MLQYGSEPSVIREIFEYGNLRRAEVGEANVYDYSLGNPSIKTPNEFTDELKRLIDSDEYTNIHGYTSGPGDKKVKEQISEFINTKYNYNSAATDFYMTCGAAASLTISLNAIAQDNSEVIVFAPYFAEYKVFIEKSGNKMIPVLLDEKDFQIDFNVLEKAVNKNTIGLIVNSPNNPTGTIFSKETIVKLSEFLLNKEREYNHPIYIISDEPYIDLIYDDIEVPFIAGYYHNTIRCYSYSKALSIPGERIGYIMIASNIDDKDDLFYAICGAGRALGYVCAPSLMQRAVANCSGITSDISLYKKNRDLLYKELTNYGYDIIYPQGAFYMFIQSPSGDGIELCNRAKKYDILMVPSDSFGIKGYARIAYCVDEEMIRKSLPFFKKLIEEYKG